MITKLITLSKILASLMLSVLASLAGWIFIVPLAFIIPKSKKYIAVIGRQDGCFVDNAKYFYLQGRQLRPDLHLTFITERLDVKASLEAYDFPVLQYPSLKAIWFLLRCNAFVVDEAAWRSKMRFFLLYQAKSIQLWHGVGFKRTGLDQWRHETGMLAWASHPVFFNLRLFVYYIIGRHTKYTLVSCTSCFYRDKVFSHVFHADYFPLAGYPRNDFGLSLTHDFKKLAWLNVDETIQKKLKKWQLENRRIVFIAPTYRDSGSLPMQLSTEALIHIESFAKQNDVEFIFKFHPYEKNADHIAGEHFHICSRDSDIYPLLPFTDALVTDYSSIASDYLLTSKPIVYLIPEDDNYSTKDRNLQFDPKTMMPGPIVNNWKALTTALLEEWEMNNYADARTELCQMAFDGLSQGEATLKLITLIQKSNIL